MIAIEVHNDKNYGATLVDLIKSGVPLTKMLLVHYPDHKMESQDFETAESKFGYLSDPGWLTGGKDYILTGGWYGSCHQNAFASMIKSGIAGNYHFIRDLMFDKQTLSHSYCRTFIGDMQTICSGCRFFETENGKDLC